MTPVLEVEGLAAAVTDAAGRRVLLDDISLSVAAGEVVGVLGETGAGKTLIAAAIADLAPSPVEVTSGRVVFGGRDLREDRLPWARLRGDRLALLHATPGAMLDPRRRLDVQFVEAVTAHRALHRDAALALALKALRPLGLAPDPAGLAIHPHELPPAAAQRVAIAMALVNDPDLIIADDVLRCVDRIHQPLVLADLRRRVRDGGAALLWLSPRPQPLLLLADRMAVLYGGRLVEEARTSDLWLEPAHPYTRALLDALPSRTARGERLATSGGGAATPMRTTGCPFRYRCSMAMNACLRPPERRLAGPPEARRFVRCHHPLVAVRATAVGGETATASAEVRSAGEFRTAQHEAGPASPPRECGAQSGGAALLVLSGATALPSTSWTLRPRARWAGPPPGVPQNIDLAVEAGEIVGVLGDSGTDLTAFARLAAGIVAPCRGERRVDLPAAPGGDARMLQRETAVQLIPRGPGAGLDPMRSICEQVSEAPLARGLIRHHQRVEYAGLHLNRVGLDPSLMHRYPHQFAPDQRVRAAIARTLAVGAQLVVCDDPLADLDVPAQAALLNLLAELREATGLAWLYAGHDPGIVGHLADRVLLLCRGTPVESGAVAEVLAAPVHPYAVALVAGPDGVLHARSPVARPPAQEGRDGGCRFRGECAFAIAACQGAIAAAVLPGDHRVACVRAAEFVQSGDDAQGAVSGRDAGTASTSPQFAAAAGARV